ncbi:MAG: hypothetical protein PHT77_13030 [Bacteroidales bacterium]|nr:hypothetical protein [Bacteroidales bacterium]
MKNDKHIDEVIFVDDFYRSAYQYDYIEYRNSELMFWDRSYENNMSYILNNEYFIRKQDGWIDTLFLKGKIEKNICNDYFPTLVDTIRIKVLSENTEFEVEICKKYSCSDYFQWSALTTLTK